VPPRVVRGFDRARRDGVDRAHEAAEEAGILGHFGRQGSFLEIQYLRHTARAAKERDVRRESPHAVDADHIGRGRAHRRHETRGAERELACKASQPAKIAGARREWIEHELPRASGCARRIGVDDRRHLVTRCDGGARERVDDRTDAAHRAVVRTEEEESHAKGRRARPARIYRASGSEANPFNRRRRAGRRGSARDPVPVEALADDFDAPCAETLRAPGRAEQRLDRTCERARVLGRHEHTRLTVDDGVGRPVGCARHDRASARHRLEADERQAWRDGRDDRGAAIERGQPLWSDVAEEMNATLEMERAALRAETDARDRRPR
jgi:hypothetical protein